MLIERSAQLSQVVPLDAFAVSRDREVHSYLSIFIAFNKSETFRIKEEEKKSHVKVIKKNLCRLF